MKSLLLSTVLICFIPALQACGGSGTSSATNPIVNVETTNNENQDGGEITNAANNQDDGESTNAASSQDDGESTNAASSQDDGESTNAATDNEVADPIVLSPITSINLDGTRQWLGPNFWANPLQDWSLVNGEIAAVPTSFNLPRMLLKTDRTLGADTDNFRMSITLRIEPN